MIKIGKFIDPSTDFAFKRLLGDETVLLDFLNAVFFGLHVFKSVTIKDKEKPGHGKKQKTVVLDLRCITDKNEEIIIEMQRSFFQFFFDRTLFYAAVAIRNQIDKGAKSYKLSPVYVVSVLNYAAPDLIKGDSFRSIFALTNQDNPKIVYDKLLLVYLQLPKFDIQTIGEASNRLERWMWVLKNITKLETMPKELEGDPIFERVFETAEVANLTKRERMEYMEDFKIEMDAIAAEQSALELGYSKGMEKGREEGMEKGVLETKKEMALKMLRKGKEISEVMEFTELSYEEVERLRDML